MIILAILSLALSFILFTSGCIIAGVIALVMAALFVISNLMGRQVVKAKRNGMHIIVAVISIALLIPVFLFANYAYEYAYDVPTETITWSDISLHEMLPEPGSDVGRIISNDKSSLSLDINKTSADEYEDYINACKDKGFTYESDEGDLSYTAFNKKGYALDLSYYEDEEEMSISLDAPKKMSEFTWPVGTLSTLLPEPKSNIGSVESDSSDDFTIYVGKTSLSAYGEYVKACQDKGFNVDYSKDDKSFSGDNSDGYSLSVEYKGNNVMYISIDAYSVSDKAKKKAKSKTSSNTDSSGVTPKFKKTMDSYEDFFDDYIAFMKKYEDSDDTSAMLSDYSSYMSKYTSMMEKLDSIDEDELSDADAAYYVKVQSRINEKLTDAAL